MKGKSKRIAQLLISVVAALMLIVSMATMSFAEGGNEAVANARNGVVHIRVVFQGDDGDYDIQWGTGFLVNDVTVVTCYHVIDVEPDIIAAISESGIPGGAGKSEKQIRDKIAVKISVVRDSFIEAKVIDGAYSKAADFATLKLSQSLGGATVLPIRNSDEVNVTENATVLGYPFKQVLNKGYDFAEFTKETVDVTQGNVKQINTEEGVRYVYLTGTITSGYSGGPVVDDNGNVIAIAKRNDLDNQAAAVGSKELMDVFDRLEIDYQAAGAAETVEPEPEPESEPVTPPTEVEEQKPEKKNFPVIPVAIGAAVVAVGAILAIVLGSRKKNQNTPAPAPSPAPAPQQFGATAAPKVPPAYTGGVDTGVLGQGSNETTVLGQGSNETTVLSQNHNMGYLVRNKTGEKISITRDNFKIGKERSRVDYCISDNTNITRHHCTIITKGGETFIVDNRSTNFTFVNDVKSDPGVETKLKNGDKITLADETFIFNAN